MNEELRALIDAVEPLDAAAMAEARRWQDRLAKPPGSLGRLEDAAVRLAGITGRTINSMNNCRIVVLCADNGICEEGVGSAPRNVTAAQAVNMTRGLTGMSVMARAFGDRVQVVDMGIAESYDCPEILDRRISRGTKNFLKESAMTREETEAAILAGAELARTAKEEGVTALGVGEMGIGNTTTSAAVLCALTGLSPQEVTGRGGGITDAAFARKRETIRLGLERRRPDAGDPVDALSQVGGLDLAAMCGVFLGAARCRIPAVVDGLISIVAALCAARLCPTAAEYMFPSHASFEIGYALAARELGLEPWLRLDMRLGEGSGCPLAFRVLEAACACAGGMATFACAGIDDEYLKDIRGKDCFSV